MHKTYKIILTACIGILFLQACTSKQQKVVFVVEHAETGMPTIKIPYAKNTTEKAQWETIAGLFLLQNGKAATSPVACQYQYKTDTLYLQPMQPLAQGAEFEIQFIADGNTTTHRFSIPQNAERNTVPQVEAIYPLTDTIPANILMFHVRFTTPMQEDVLAFKHIKLLDEKGREKNMVWREKSNWDDSGKHLVLMLHPGRVKRGINYFKNEGDLFEVGKKYTLVITQELKTTFGIALPNKYTKTFVVAKPDREIPAFNTTKTTIPAASSQPVTLNFNEAMDYGSMCIGVVVSDSKGKKILGKINPVNDSQYTFTPSQPWAKGLYTIQLLDYVSDLASNHLRRRFEEETLDSASQRQPVELNIEIE